MAKSIRSKRKRKLRAARREKLKPKVKAKLEEILGLSDKEMIVETEGYEEDKNEEKAQGETLKNQEGKITVNAAATEGTEDVVMKSEDGTQKKLGKKAPKRINQKKKLKRLTNKKRKNQKKFKW